MITQINTTAKSREELHETMKALLGDSVIDQPLKRVGDGVKCPYCGGPCDVEGLCIDPDCKGYDRENVIDGSAK